MERPLTPEEIRALESYFYKLIRAKLKFIVKFIPKEHGARDA